MEKFKKLLGPLSGLSTVSLVLVIAIVALFMTNQGFGWFTIGDHAEANGAMVDVTNPDSPVESFQFYMVKAAEVKETTVEGEPVLYNEYLFEQLNPTETARMDMKSYSKLEAPKYHILLHVHIKDEYINPNGATTIYMDTHITGETYTIEKSEIPAMAGISDKKIGMSAALEFSVITAGVGALSTVTEGEETKYQRLYVDMPGYRDEGHLFPMQSTETTLVFSGMDLVEITMPQGTQDIFIFITYSAERINMLQEYAITEAENGTGNDMSDLDNNFSFMSDFYIFFKDKS